VQLSRKALRFVWMFFLFLYGVDSKRKNSQMALVLSSGRFKTVILAIVVTLDRAVPATHAPLSMEASELSNLGNSNTGKVSVLSQPPDPDFDMPHAATPDQRRPAAESAQEARIRTLIVGGGKRTKYVLKSEGSNKGL